MKTFNEKCNEAQNWLAANSFTTIYSNHPSSETREFHFIKDNIRVILYISEVKPTYYVQIKTPVNSFNTEEEILHINSNKYNVGDNRIFTAHRLIKDYLYKLDHKSLDKERAKEEAQQTIWETWFLISILALLGLLFTGTLINSRVVFPNWTAYTLLACFNLLACIIVGVKKPV